MAGNVKTDQVSENTLDAGVTIDGLLIKDGIITYPTSQSIQLNSASADLTLTIENTDATYKANLNVENDITATSFTIGANTLDTNEWAYLDGLDQAVKTTSAPTFAGLTVDTDTLHIDVVNHRVGIGTTAPGYKLDVNGNINMASAGVLRTGGTWLIGRESAGGTTQIYSDWHTDFKKGSTINMRIDTNGNVGIGTTTPNSLLQVAGAIATTVATKTSAYTVTASDSVLLGDASGGAFTITLPTAVGIAGREYIFKKIDSSANAVTIDGDGTETIDGATTYDLTSQYQFIRIVSDGSNWLITGS